jgi:hypothetical protein
MKKYTLIFCISFLVLTIVLAAVAGWLEIKAGAGFGVMAIFAASSLAAWKFTKDNNRPPTLEEKKIYAWQALLGAWIVTFLLVAVMFVSLSPSDTKSLLDFMATKTFLFIATCVSVFTSLIYYLSIRWSFAWYAKMACKKQLV